MFFLPLYSGLMTAGQRAVIDFLSVSVTSVDDSFDAVETFHCKTAEVRGEFWSASYRYHYM